MTPVRILIVDDNEALADNICDVVDMLEQFEVTCVIAPDASSAMDEADAREIDLAIVDLHLPDQDGFELAAKLRQRRPHAQVIIVTGDATVESAIEAVRRGAFAYVLKPFQAQTLLDTADRALRQTLLERDRDSLRQALEASELRHRQVVELMPAFVLALDATGTIRVWNAELERVTGLSRDEMIGKPGAELVGSGGDRRLPGRAGAHRLVRWRLTRVPDGQPGEADTYAMGVDITDEAERLRRRVRTERLAAAGTLAAGLAHEVRNPLNSANLQLQVLERRIGKLDVDTSDLRPVIETVRDEIRRLDGLVNDFLAFARPQDYELQPVELNDVVEKAAHLVQPEAQTAGIEVDLRLDAEVGAVKLDPQRFRQVLLNLFRNSIEAMSGGGRLHVGTHRADAEGFASVEVRDTGGGFPDEAPIFDAFYTTKDGGTGLGLAIVHRIVSEHSGTIQTSSADGGAVVRVRLPEAPAN